MTIDVMVVEDYPLLHLKGEMELNHDLNTSWRRFQHYIRTSQVRSPQLTHLYTMSKCLLPSFIKVLIDKTPRSPKKSSSNNISALDGLRGISCLMVMHMHWTYAITDSYSNGAEANIHFLFHRPFFQLFWAGHSHVNIFFVMSGYVLSVKCFSLIHKRQPVSDVIASAVFRRAMRIFLPPLFLLMLYFVSIRIGMFDRSNQLWTRNKKYMDYQLALFENPPLVMDSFFEQLAHVTKAGIRLLDPSEAIYLSDYQLYDSHLWTMPTEFYCSLTLYIILLATSRLQTVYRLSIHILLFLFNILVGHIYPSLFIAGMTVAEIDLLFKNRQEQDTTALPTSQPTPSSPQPMLFSFSTTESLIQTHYLTRPNLICVTSFISGLYLLSLPLVFAEQTPGFRSLITNLPSFLSTPQRIDVLRALGAILTVWPITHTSQMHNSPYLTSLIFTNPISHYLGQISFSFYLVHGYIIRGLGYTILPTIYRLALWDQDRVARLAGYEVPWDPTATVRLEKLTAPEVARIWVAGYCIVLPATIWLADLFWRAVDTRCLGWARAVEDALTHTDHEPHEPTQEKVS